MVLAARFVVDPKNPAQLDQPSWALGIVFGPAMGKIANPDRLQAGDELNAFSRALRRTSFRMTESCFSVKLRRRTV
jgi:hypothetical protein